MEQNTGPTAPAYAAFESAPAPAPRLTRSRDEKMIAGVCGGVGRAYGVDPALLRIALVLLTVFGVGAGAVLYLAAWILVPQEP